LLIFLNTHKKTLSGRGARTRVFGENTITMDYVKDEESIRLVQVKFSMPKLYYHGNEPQYSKNAENHLIIWITIENHSKPGRPRVFNLPPARLYYATRAHICKLYIYIYTRKITQNCRRLCIPLIFIWQLRAANQPTIMVVALCHKNLEAHYVYN
jgi:hypothetical protein